MAKAVPVCGLLLACLVAVCSATVYGVIGDEDGIVRLATIAYASGSATLVQAIDNTNMSIASGGMMTGDSAVFYAASFDLSSNVGGAGVYGTDGVEQAIRNLPWPLAVVEVSPQSGGVLAISTLDGGTGFGLFVVDVFGQSRSLVADDIVPNGYDVAYSVSALNAVTNRLFFVATAAYNSSRPPMDHPRADQVPNLVVQVNANTGAVERTFSVPCEVMALELVGTDELRGMCQDPVMEDHYYFEIDVTSPYTVDINGSPLRSGSTHYYTQGVSFVDNNRLVLATYSSASSSALAALVSVSATTKNASPHPPLASGDTLLTAYATPVATGPATTLFLRAQAGTETAGETFAPILVEVRDDVGFVVDTDSVTVTLSYYGGPGGGAAGLTPALPLTATTDRGVATFAGMTASVSGTYTFRASASGLIADTRTWTVVANVAARLLILQHPPLVVERGVVWPSVVTVGVGDFWGNPTVVFGTEVVSIDVNSAFATLNGVKSRSFVGPGSVSVDFPLLDFVARRGEYTIEATSQALGLLPAISNEFEMICEPFQYTDDCLVYCHPGDTCLWANPCDTDPESDTEGECRDTSTPAITAVAPDTIRLYGEWVYVHGSDFLGAPFPPDRDGPLEFAIIMGSGERFAALPSETFVNSTELVLVKSPDVGATGYATLEVVNWDGGVAALEKVYINNNCPTPGDYGEQGDCSPCPDCATCPGGYRVWPEPGCWNSGENDTDVVRCDPPERCLGYQDGLVICADGYTGDLCGSCDLGYFARNDVCLPCSAQTNWLLWVTQALFVLLYLTVTIVGTEAALSVFFFLLIIAQALRAIGQISSEQQPEFLKQFYSLLAIVTFDPEFVKPGCTLGGSSFTSKFLLSAIFILVVVTILFIALPVYGYLRASHWPRHHKPAYWRAFAQKRRIRAIVMYIHFIYINLTTLALTAMYCIKAGDRRVLYIEPGQVCFDLGHSVVFSASVLILLLISIGFPAGLFTILVKFKEKLDDKRVLHPLGSMYVDFKRPSYLYGCAWILEMFAQAFSSAILADNFVPQFILSVGVTLGFLTYILWKKPYRKAWRNYVAAIVLCLCSYGLVLNFVGIISEASSTVNLILGIAMVVVIGIVVVVVAIRQVLGMVHEVEDEEEIDYDAEPDPSATKKAPQPIGVPMENMGSSAGKDKKGKKNGKKKGKKKGKSTDATPAAVGNHQLLFYHDQAHDNPLWGEEFDLPEFSLANGIDAELGAFDPAGAAPMAPPTAADLFDDTVSEIKVNPYFEGGGGVGAALSMGGSRTGTLNGDNYTL